VAGVLNGVRLASALLVVAAIAGVGATAARSSVKTATLAVGDVFVARGQTGRLPGAAHDAVGVVVVRASWNGGAWHVLTTVRTDAAGRYRFTLAPHRHGRLTLRIQPPDRQIQVFVLHVV